MSMKTNEIVKIGEKVVDEYKNFDFNNIMSEYAFKNNLRITLLDKNGEIARGSDGFGMTMQPGLNHFPMGFFDRIEEEFSKTDDDHVHFSAETGTNEMSQIVYVAKVEGVRGDLNYLCIISPVPPIDSTTTVLSTQFIVITAIIFVLSLIIAQLISRKMSKPIIKLTKSAEKLAAGDMKVNFEGESYTEIYQLASTLNYATHELSKLDNYRKDFIANISHDLKTPLTIIKMYGEMIRDIGGENPDKQKAHSQQIVKEADWLSGMVNEILELSKLESGNAEIVKTEVDLSMCLKDTLSSFEVLSYREGYVFETDIDSHLYVQGSEQYLRRILYNLISNAVNYTGENKTIRVSLEDLGNKVRFTVTDFGNGIPADKLNNIWDRYYKSNEVHKRAVVGTGLGLSIVKNSLELHSAAYGVQSEEGKGSTFWFEMKK
ncbi:HAMP domain-containing sensor histidine kinase [Faecalicatena contorta]|nr:HAMP domain-containing sensor histidine kinase [Faecalicatena contorta]